MVPRKSGSESERISMVIDMNDAMAEDLTGRPATGDPSGPAVPGDRYRSPSRRVREIFDAGGGVLPAKTDERPGNLTRTSTHSARSARPGSGPGSICEAGVTLERLEKVGLAQSDNEAAEQLNPLRKSCFSFWTTKAANGPEASGETLRPPRSMPERSVHFRGGFRLGPEWEWTGERAKKQNRPSGRRSGTHRGDGVVGGTFFFQQGFNLT